MWCVPELTTEFIERMEDILRLYARKFDSIEPVLCLDERPVVLHHDARRGLPMRPAVLSAPTTSTSAAAPPTSSASSSRSPAGG